MPCVARWPAQIPAHSTSNGIQSHEDLFVTLAAAAGLPNLKTDLLDGYKMNGTTYKVHLDGYNNLVRVGAWKMHIGLKKEGLWWNDKYYPSVPYLFNLLMDPMEKMDPESHEWGYVGHKFFAAKMWAPTAATPFLAAHLKSLQAYPPRQSADTLSLHKALEAAMDRLETSHTTNN